MDNDITDADLEQWNEEELLADDRAKQPTDPLNWTEEEEAMWAFEDKLDMYRNEY